MREEGFLYLYQSYHPGVFPEKKGIMAFFNSAVAVLQTHVIALGAGLGIWVPLTCLKVMAMTTQALSPPLRGLRALLGRRHEAVDGRRRRRPHRHHSGASSFRPVRLYEIMIRLFSQLPHKQTDG